MLLTQLIRDTTDVELERLAREDTLWMSCQGYRGGDGDYTEEGGCLFCNAVDARNQADYRKAQIRFGGEFITWRDGLKPDVEGMYMRLTMRNGGAETGEMIARLARRELGRRAMLGVRDIVASLDLEAVSTVTT